MPENQEFLSVRQVAERYGIGVSTIYRGVRTGTFPAPLKICGMNRWAISNLPDQALESDDA